MPVNPQLETKQENQYNGINQRTYPTLLEDNVFTFSEGVVYRSGKASRINGKQTFYKATSPILAILQTLHGVIVQTQTQVLYFSLDYFNS